MDISIFDVVGPVMIGPSSSHTAGAAALSRIGREIIGEPFSYVSFGLHGSFADTGAGHGTDRALVAGALGMRPDDERIRDSFRLAKEAGMGYDFHRVELEDVHENTVQMVFTLRSGRKREIIGSSIGGGRIIITRIDGYETALTAQSNTIMVEHRDVPGVVSGITRALALNHINIANMQLARKSRGDMAFTIIEVDQSIDDMTLHDIDWVDGVKRVQVIGTVESLADAMEGIFNV